MPSTEHYYSVLTLDYGVDGASLLTEATVDAFGHVDVYT